MRLKKLILKEGDILTEELIKFCLDLNPNIKFEILTEEVKSSVEEHLVESIDDIGSRGHVMVETNPHYEEEY